VHLAFPRRWSFGVWSDTSPRFLSPLWGFCVPTWFGSVFRYLVCTRLFITSSLTQVLDLKEQQAQVVKSQFRKEAQRTRRVEERMFLTARARIEEEMKHVERIMEREEERRRAAEDIRRRAEEKEREVQAALERKAYELAERRRLKQTAR